MKRFYLFLLLDLAVGAGLAFLTASTLRSINHVSNSELYGWVIFSPAGTLTGLLPLALILLLCTADSLWLISSLVLLLKRVFHIKSNDRTTYLP